MITCEKCQKLISIDEMNQYEYNGEELELCQQCYEEMIQSEPLFEEDDNTKEFKEDDKGLIYICPKCGSDLKLDYPINNMNIGQLYCSNEKCEFTKDLTQEQINYLDPPDEE